MKLSKAQIESICELREAGRSYPDIAARFGVSPSTVYYHCLLHAAHPPGYDLRPPPRLDKTWTRGRHTVRPFTPEDDRLMTEMRLAGERPSAISRRLNRRQHSVTARLAALARREDFANA